MFQMSQFRIFNHQFKKGLCIRMRSLWRLLPALTGVSLFTLVSLASLIAPVLHGDSSRWLDDLSHPYVWRVVRFSLWQALLSTLLSIGLAVPVASALAHRDFKGRKVLLQLFAVAMVVPTIVAILGIVVVYGHNGWLASGLGLRLPLYGLSGILLAHVFFNLPLAVRLLLQAYSLIPGSQWRLASQFGFSRWQAFRRVEWHYVRQSLPGVFLLIFMLCFTSFAVVLSLGGGPRSSTLEVVIYQALRFEFDLSKAGLFALLQVVICSLVAFLIYRFIPMLQQDFSLSMRQAYPLRDSIAIRLWDAVWIVLLLLLVLPPFMAIFAPAFSPLFLRTLLEPSLWYAVTVSLKIALPAACLAVLLGYGFVVLARFVRCHPSLYWMTSKIECLGNLILMVPGLVLATGLFLLLQQWGWGPDVGYWIVIWVNVAMSLPFVLRVLLPVCYQQERRFRRLYTGLNIYGWYRFKLEWPLLRNNFAQAFGYAALLSLGDMGAIALFGSEGLTTLPLYLFRLLGTYRLEQGSCVAILLILLCLLLFWLSMRLIGGGKHYA